MVTAASYGQLESKPWPRNPERDDGAAVVNPQVPVQRLVVTLSREERSVETRSVLLEHPLQPDDEFRRQRGSQLPLAV